MKLALLLVMAPLLASCAAVSYKPPTSGATARLRIATDSPELVVVRGYPKPNCSGEESEWMRISTGPRVGAKEESLGIPLWSYSPQSAKELLVAANADINLLFIGSTTAPKVGGYEVTSCGVPLTANLEVGKDYELAYSVTPGRCNVRLYSISSGDSPARTVIREFTNRVTESNKGCMDQVTKMRLY